MTMLAQFAITFGAWLALLIVSTNLVGFLVRGLFTNPELDRLELEGHDFIKGVVRQHRKTEQTANVVALALVVAFLLALYHFWNVGVAIAAAMLMAARITDVIWELRHASKLRLRDMRQPALWLLNTLLSWMSLPVLWYALYRM
jgi:hypothetical protein